MIEVLEFTFRSGWHFAGVATLLIIICITICSVVASICRRFTDD